MSKTGVGVPVVFPSDLADFKAVRWSPDGSHLILATGQQPGDPLWKGIALADSKGNIQSWVGDVVDFSWAPDSSHFVAMPLYPISHGSNNLPFFAGLSFFPTGRAGLTGPDLSGVQDLGIGRPGFPDSAGWQNESNAVVVLSDVVSNGGGYQPDAQQTVSAWLTAPGSGVPAANVTSAHGAIQAAVSHDGSKVAFVDRESVTITPLDGSAGCRESLSTSGNAPDPLLPTIAWSPDNSRIAIAIANDSASYLWVIANDCTRYSLIASGNYIFGDTYTDVSGQPSTAPMRVSGEFVCGAVEWSNDGQTIYFTGLTADNNGHGVNVPPPDFDLRRISVNGGPSQLVVPGVESFDLAP
jgi:hypothetical protein